MPVSEDSVLRALPPDGFVTRLCSWSYETSDSPLVYSLGSALILLSLFVPPDVELGSIYAPNWAILVGDIALRKSYALGEALKILDAVRPGLKGTKHESVALLFEAMS